LIIAVISDMQEMYFDDGASPPESIITKWLSLVDNVFANNIANSEEAPCIAVHCVAGLGR
jgi:protein tyrosine phosphatase type 4A